MLMRVRISICAPSRFWSYDRVGARNSSLAVRPRRAGASPAFPEQGRCTISMSVVRRYAPMVPGALVVFALAGTGLAVAGHTSPPSSSGPAQRAAPASCANPPCVDGAALDGRVNIFVTRAEFARLARRWCALRSDATRAGVRFVIHQTGGIVAEWSKPTDRRDVWNVAIAKGPATMAQGVAVDVRLEARYTVSGHAFMLDWRRRPGAPSLPCAAHR